MCMHSILNLVCTTGVTGDTTQCGSRYGDQTLWVNWELIVHRIEGDK